MRVAIMQPTYLPWSGYFGLMASVDLFIVLDTVQFSRRSWQQRNQIKTGAGAHWLTVPVLTKGNRKALIKDIRIDNNTHFADKHTKTIACNYSKASFYNEIAPIVLSSLTETHEKLVDLNMRNILCYRELLEANASVVRSSELKGRGSRADLLASLCDYVGASEYISVPGSREYLEDSDAFSSLGIPIKYFSYKHPVYSQLHGEFIPYMSVLDILFNCGSEKATILIKEASGVAQ